MIRDWLDDTFSAFECEWFWFPLLRGMALGALFGGAVYLVLSA